MKALIGADLIDGTGRPVLKDSAILIDGERVTEVGPRGAVTLPPGTEEINLSGLTLLPGLIDTHDHLAHKNYSLDSRWEIEEPASVHHLKTARAIEESLAAGYTCIRDAGGLDSGFKYAVEQGLLNGPRLLTSVAIVSPTGGIGDRVAGSGHRNPFNNDPMHVDGVANGPDAIRALVRELVRVGADVIKFATTGGASSRSGHGPKDIAFGPDEVKALVDEAKSQEKYTMCHAVGGPGLRMCIEAGVGSVEHACYLAEDPDLAKMMADKNVFFTPTFEVYEFHSTISAPHIIERTKQLMQIHQESLHLAVSAGVKVSAGTDAGGFVHGDNAREIELMVERGLSNMQAIQTATGWAAECIGEEKNFGTVGKGKYADFLIVDGDPLKDISVIRNKETIKMVMKGGVAYIDRLPIAEPQLAD
ncbi:MAG: amidohydrolase family protein [SAR202 cluster bacterium]|jgi:imidazolonepropionase-like amidohydrolase|nr:amidohydrolase family protein [Dehalococcoidia bacterium]MQF88088.1 amidohydrolase family protein [SAR202 cluster bacterium]|tara:strand:- start:181 stop:1434 length:1254 start_codon:yes stop_codon:yes gene_type:complete